MFAFFIFFSAGRQTGLVGRQNVAEHIAQGVRMAMCLPLLSPNLFIQGCEAVEQHFHLEPVANEGTVQQFNNYLRRQWSRANISVYRLGTRSNNAVEGFHSILKRTIGRSHPSFWVFLGELQKLEHGRACDILRLQQGLQRRERPRRAYRNLDRRIGKGNK